MYLKIIVSLFFALVLLVGCGKQDSTFEVVIPETNDPTTSKPESHQVKVLVAKKGIFYNSIFCNGIIKSKRDITIVSQTSGLIKDLFVTNGDYVEKRDPILNLENKKKKLSLAKAIAERESARIRYKSELLAFGDVTDSIGYERIKNSVRHQSGLVMSELMVQEALLNLDYAMPKAAFSGIVKNLKVQNQNFITEGQEICELFDPEVLYIESEIIESDFQNIEIGKDAIIELVSNYKETPIIGRICEINPSVDSETGMMKIKICMNLNSNQRIIPGMNASATISVEVDSGIVIPKQAVLLRSGKHVVFTVDNDKAKWNDIEIVLDNGEDVLISGIDSGDQVIVSNHININHDTPIVVSW